MRMGTAERTGAPKADVLAELEAGTRESRTLAEALSVDFARLLSAAVPQAGVDAAQTLQVAAREGVVRRMVLAGAVLLDRLGPEAVPQLTCHGSDTVRGWACYMIGALPDLEFGARLEAMRPLAADAHFGVREWAWMALRGHIGAAPDAAIAELLPWCSESDERLRRFASEATRPRGVWCAHIGILRAEPWRAAALLEALREDSAVYVQLSVGNWLNDAAKDQPDWVRALAARWRAETASPHTAHILRRAVRSLPEVRALRPRRATRPGS
ncbi:DNA alkylation repair protein [Falsiroseomonas sp. E2-1-a20]|uniref:DNA alkylation repair protein n=1 Tax=Falsiroseomonas sp. E2-1-a20 TaxID=3239300 RepID=UPI003F3B544B